MDQEPQPNEPIAGDRLLKALGIDPNKWTVGDRRIAFLGIGIGLSIVIIAVGGYAFGWAWTGLTEPGITAPKQRTFWDWLSLLIVPIVLALGGYLFNRSESRRTKEDAEQQRALEREIAEQRRQADTLQAYLDQMGQLLLDKDRPLRQSEAGDEVRTLARARTLAVLRRLDRIPKVSVLQFLYEAGLIAKNKVVVDLRGADLTGISLISANLSEAILTMANLKEAFLFEVILFKADLRGANLSKSYLRGADLRGAILTKAILIKADLREADLRGADLRGADLSFADLRFVGLLVGLKDADLRGANLLRADLRGANLSEAILSRAILSRANLQGARGITNEELDQQAFLLSGATMPNGQKYEDWLKDKAASGEKLTAHQRNYLDRLRDKEGRGEDGENSGPRNGS